MLSPGSAFLLAYLPSRQVAQLVLMELTVRTAATIAATVRPLLTTPVLKAAWAAGEAARTMQVATSAGARAAHLRCAAPTHPELREVAEARQHRVPTAAGRALEAKYGPLRWLHREPPP